MYLTDPEIEFLTDIVAECSGNVIQPRQAYMLEQQLTPIAKRIGLDDVAELVNSLRKTDDQSLANLVAEAVTVNETSFFRDAHLFDALKTTIIPELVQRLSDVQRIRIWSAACSCGQEPFTIAMILRDHFPELIDWNVEIIATDISDEMISKSETGEYSQLEVNRGLPAHKLVRFFEQKGPTWRVKEELKELIEFRKLNLKNDWPPFGQFDLVFVRNVLIYFNQNTKSEILNRVRRVMRPDSYLFIGSAETTIGLGVPFQREEIDATFCYRPTGHQ